ncbi:MAG: TrmH family RNA methyltransferase [Bacteriovoracaceae bacterium]
MMSRKKYQEKLFLQEMYLNKTEAKLGPHQMIMVLDHLKDDFNIGKIFRSAEILGAEQIFIVGTKFFDCIPAKGTVRKLKCEFFPDFASCYQRLVELDYNLLGLDVKGEKFLGKLELPKKTAFIMGHEEFGLSFKVEDYTKIELMKIKQFGKTQSLNVAVAASLVMQEYNRQHHLD